jgi:carbonic anhydrase
MCGFAGADRDYFDQGFGDLFVTRIAGNVADLRLVNDEEYRLQGC